MSLEINDLYRFEGFEVDPANRTLTGGGKPISIPARAFDLLLFMAGNSQRLLTKEELMQAVWGNAAVEEGNLTQSVFLLRKALSANPPTDRPLIVTVPGHGYRFAARVEQVDGSRDRTHLKVEVAEKPRTKWSRVASNRWFLAGAAVIAMASVALLLGISRRQATGAMPVPHPVTTNSAEDPVIAASLSPDGRYLAYADDRFITLRTLRTAETRAIPVGAGVRPMKVAWYPDGTRLLVGERANDASSIRVFSILSGKLSLLREDAASPLASPDGNRVFCADGTYRELWLMDANGENPRRILTALPPEHVYPLFWSPDGMRVWFARVHWDKNADLITLETRDLNGARGTVVLSDNRTSAFCLLPPGRLIYAVVEAASQKFTNLWEMAVDPAEGRPRGPARRLTNWANFSISGLSATADGRHVALTNGTWQADVYVGDLRAGGAELANPRRLTLDQSDALPAFWTPDDRAVVFESNRNGRSQIFRQRLDQTVPELLSMDSEEDQCPRFGGEWIYFFSLPLGRRLASDEPNHIRRIPMAGGASSEVLAGVGIDMSCAARRPDTCVVSRLTGKTLAFYRFDPARGPGAEIGRMEFDSPSRPDWEVSPDGSEVAAVDSRGQGNRIRRIPLGGGHSSEVELPGRKGLANLFWAADGKGWFVASQAPTGEYLLHVNPQGDCQVLFEQPDAGRVTWGIPSYDGKQLAWLRWISSKNVWMIDGF